MRKTETDRKEKGRRVRLLKEIDGGGGGGGCETRKGTHGMTLQRRVKHHLAEVLAAVLGDLGLLLGVAMVLKRQDHRIFRRLEGAFCNSLNDFLKPRRKRPWKGGERTKKK